MHRDSGTSPCTTTHSALRCRHFCICGTVHMAATPSHLALHQGGLRCALPALPTPRAEPRSPSSLPLPAPPPPSMAVGTGNWVRCSWQAQHMGMVPSRHTSPVSWEMSPTRPFVSANYNPFATHASRTSSRHCVTAGARVQSRETTRSRHSQQPSHQLMFHPAPLRLHLRC